MRVVMLAFPRMTQLDLTGPFEVFSRFPEVTVDLAWKNTRAVEDANGLKIMPTVKMKKAAQADILFVPGGPGQMALMQDAEVLEFLRTQAAGAKYVTSVCTGSLVLASAGLLSGYRATCHWLSLADLALFGAEPVAERVVVDRNRVTGAGVTSGLDFALALMGEVFGPEHARRIALAMEYDPKPPFPGGSPASALPEDVEAVTSVTARFQDERRRVALAAAAAMKAPL
ncbi:DJ-1/PfpI family protein [Segnochrobactraceae bacterium EtOH-i3]